MVTGDDIACAEAKVLLGNTHCVQVKKAVSRYSAVCFPYAQTLEQLTKGAETALKNADKCNAYKVPSPSTIKIRMVDPAMADGAELMPGVKRLGPLEIEFSHAEYPVLFKQFLAVGVLAAARRDPYF
jgi:D-amino peptidase